MTKKAKQKKKRKRGRPRKHIYVALKELFWMWQNLNAKYQDIVHKRKFFYVVASSLAGVLWRNLEAVGTLTDVYALEGKEPTLKIRDKGNCFRNEATGETDLGDSLVFDLKHDPPRMRVLLTNGKRLDVVLRCPMCHAGAEGDDALFLAEFPSKEPTETGFDVYIQCYGNHINWKLKEVEEFLRSEGYLK